MNLLISCDSKAQDVTVPLHFNDYFTAQQKQPSSKTGSKLWLLTAVLEIYDFISLK